MISTRIFVLTILLVSAQTRQIAIKRESYPTRLYVDDRLTVLDDDLEDVFLDKTYELVHPRVTRQLHGSMSTNPDGSSNLNAKLPLVGNSNNVFSAIGAANGLKPGGAYGAATGGLQLENVNGHSLSVMKTHIPSFGNQLTAAGKVNLLNTDNHNLNANAFVTRNMPKFPNVPNFNTHGGSVDYSFKNKVGASLGMSQTPFLQKTDYSAMGNLNLFRDRASSLDFNAGATRSMSPFIPKSRWEPSFGLTFSRGF